MACLVTTVPKAVACLVTTVPRAEACLVTTVPKAVACLVTTVPKAVACLVTTVPRAVACLVTTVPRAVACLVLDVCCFSYWVWRTRITNSSRCASLFPPPSAPHLILINSTCCSFDSSDHRQANGSVASSPFQHVATTPMLHQRWTTHSSVLHRRKRFTASYLCVRVLRMSKHLLESAGLVLQASDFAWHKRGEKTPPPPLLREGRELSQKSCRSCHHWPQ